MEVLATAATTGQLITNCFQIAITISELRDRVKNAPLRFAQYARYFEQLDTTAKDIRNNPNLQSQVVYSFVSATLKETEAAQIVLDRFLKSSRKRRYLGVINGRLERNINEHLDNLDRIVQAFCLCISSMTTKQVELSVTRGIERVRQQLTESIHGRELAPYQPRSVNSKRRNQRAKRAARKNHRAALLMQKPTMPEPTFNPTEGSTTYGKITIEGSNTFSVGIITDGEPDSTTTIHKTTFSEIQLRGNDLYHVGKLGQSRGQLTFEVVNVNGGSEAFFIGECASFDTREEDLLKKKALKRKAADLTPQ